MLATDARADLWPSDLIQAQLFPLAFRSVFCETADRLMAQTVGQLFTVNLSQGEETANRETPVVTFWRHFLLECEGTGASLPPGTSEHDQAESRLGCQCLVILSSLLSSSSQLGGAQSPCRTSSSSPREPRSYRQLASSPLLPSPSSIPSAPPSQERRGQPAYRGGQTGGMSGFSRRASPGPTTSSCRSPPPIRLSKAPWSRPSATMCTSSQWRVREGGTWTVDRECLIIYV